MRSRETAVTREPGRSLVTKNSAAFKSQPADIASLEVVVGSGAPPVDARIARYWLIQTTRDFFNAECCFLSSRATAPRETSSG